MLTQEVLALCALAATTGVIHTLAGPDHYVPFVVLGRARSWSAARTATITVLCGLGHVLSSVALGLIGIAAGLAVTRLEMVERARGNIAAWLMIGFGLAYAAWGLRRRGRQRAHVHTHAHPEGLVHAHEHAHLGEHSHVHDTAPAARSLTPWILFTIFVFGPCEVLIPLLMVPAATHSVGAAALVVGIFGTATIGTMLTVVLLLRRGLRAIRLDWLSRNMHPLAGGTIALCGALILLGL